MNIITSLKNFFHKVFNGEVNQPSTDVVKYKFLVKIPKKKIFKHNKEVLSRINEYKKKYREILNTEATLVSKNLSFGDFYDELRTNSNLLLNLIIKHEDNAQITFDEETEIDKKLKKELNNLKLNYYEQRINEMELETIIRGIALQEVYYEKLLFLKKDKINAINEELYSLTIQLNNFYSQKEAIKREKQTYQTELETSEIKEMIVFEELEDRAKAKFDYLLSNADFIPNIIDELNGREESYLSKLAYLEKQLEIYTYQNKEVLEHIDARLEQYLDFQKITKDNKDKLLSEINYFEQVCKIFSEYGRNPLIRETINKLYRFKFELLTFDILSQKQSPFLFTNDLEFQIYEDIIMNKISKLLNLENKITQKLFGNDIKKALRIIINILKQGNNNISNYEPLMILINITKLKLLLSFEKEEGLQEFYNSTKIKYDYFVNRYGVDFNENEFTWDEYLPLSTIYRIALYDDAADFIRKTEPLFNLYTYFIDHKEIAKNIYYLPEGLINISMKTVISHEIFEKTPLGKEILNAINRNLTIVAPSTLKKWNGEILPKDSEINSIILNEGLKDIYSPDHLKMTDLVIPSTLRPIDDEDCLVWGKIKRLTFTNFRYNKNLNNRETLEYMIDSSFYKEEVKGEIFSLRIICTNLEKIILIDDDNYKIEIDVSNLISNIELKYIMSESSNIELETVKMTDEDYEQILLKLQKIIYEKTGHILFEEEPTKEKEHPHHSCKL